MEKEELKQITRLTQKEFKALTDCEKLNSSKSATKDVIEQDLEVIAKKQTTEHNDYVGSVVELTVGEIVEEIVEEIDKAGFNTTKSYNFLDSQEQHHNHVKVIQDIDNNGKTTTRLVPRDTIESIKHIDSHHMFKEFLMSSNTFESNIPPPQYYTPHKKTVSAWKNKKFSRQELYNIGVGHIIDNEYLSKSKYYNFTSAPIIIRSYEAFQETIIKLFGLVSKPTLIPAFITFQFELDPSHYNLEYIIPRSDYWEDYEYPWSKPYISRKKRDEDYHQVEGTGYSCILWLIQNNYIPCNFKVFEHEEQTEDLMYQTMIEWMEKNGYYNNSCKYK